MRRSHKEGHFVGRIGWLRAAVLGANDGIISTASIILGVASAATSKSNSEEASRVGASSPVRFATQGLCWFDSSTQPVGRAL